MNVENIPCDQFVNLCFSHTLYHFVTQFNQQKKTN